jgi:hypothetical protein
LSLTFAKSVAFSEYSVSTTNKTDRHDITEALLKVALSTITLTPFSIDLSVYLYIIILPLASGSLRSHGSTGSFGSHGNTGSVGSHKTSGFFGTHGATGSMGSHGTKTSSYGMFHKSIFLYQDNTYEMQKQMCLKHSHKNAHYFSMFSLFFSLFLALKDIWLFNLFTLSVYLIKVISEARRVPNEGYSRSTWYSGFLQHKTDSHDITDILLKVALNTITLNKTHECL